MKMTKAKLREIIREEIKKLNEASVKKFIRGRSELSKAEIKGMKKLAKRKRDFFIQIDRGRAIKSGLHKFSNSFKATVYKIGLFMPNLNLFTDALNSGGVKVVRKRGEVIGLIIFDGV